MTDAMIARITNTTPTTFMTVEPPDPKGEPAGAVGGYAGASEGPYPRGYAGTRGAWTGGIAAIGGGAVGGAAGGGEGAFSGFPHFGQNAFSSATGEPQFGQKPKNSPPWPR